MFQSFSGQLPQTPTERREAIARTLRYRLRHARKLAGLSQGAVADLAMISLQQYSAYERGACVPGAAALVGVADALDVSTDWMLGREVDLAAARLDRLKAMTPILHNLIELIGGPRRARPQRQL